MHRSNEEEVMPTIALRKFDQPNFLSGHTLWFEGAPHDAESKRIGWQVTGGTGSARCSCGELSPVLTSGQQRKAWHREHKE